MRRLGAGIFLLNAVAACNSSGAPPSAPTAAAAPVTTVTLEAGPAATVAATDPPATPASAAGATVPSASGDGGDDFYACSTDSDCVAVPKVGCCPTGHLEAVNRQSVNAYQTSFVCETKRRICPMYRILDKRQPLCGSVSHKCEMVPPDQITCNGAGPTAHACPGGFQCDGAGHCKSGAPTP